jgi:hypothetical protein
MYRYCGNRVFFFPVHFFQFHPTCGLVIIQKRDEPSLARGHSDRTAEFFWNPA